MLFSILALVFPWVCGTLAQNTKGHSVFISDEGDVAFGINVPKDDTTDIYFALRGRLSNTWTAVGLGQRDMKGALVFMMFQNEAGTNATLSTRISRGSVEPKLSPNFNVQALPGTGIDRASGTLLFNGRCSNCRSWPGGSLDVTNTREPFIYAVGPEGDLRSDDQGESVPYHTAYGWFTMDMTYATGVAHVPELQGPAGLQRGKDYVGQKDLVTVIHGIVLLVCFLGLFPLSIVVLELCRTPNVFLIAHVFTTIVALIGIALGAYSGTYYVKTKNMSTPHQVVGFIILAIILIKTILSCVNFSRCSRKTNTAGNGNPKTQHLVAISLGWLTVLLGCINGFLGYALSHHAENNKIIGGVFAAVTTILLLVLGFSHWRKVKRAKETPTKQNRREIAATS